MAMWLGLRGKPRKLAGRAFDAAMAGAHEHTANFVPLVRVKTVGGGRGRAEGVRGFGHPCSTTTSHHEPSRAIMGHHGEHAHSSRCIAVHHDELRKGRGTVK